MKHLSPWLCAALLLPLARPAAAQLGLPAANAQTASGTYTDLGTGGTAIATANQDDANSAPQPIGFAFPFAGRVGGVSSFILNTNGFLSLAGTAPSAANQFLSYAQLEGTGSGPTNFPGGPLDGPDNFLVMPFATDLMAASSGPASYRYQTTGTAPNRVCTVQWKNVKDKPRAINSTTPTLVGTQYDNFSFQAKLYENGQIEFVYGSATAGTGPDDYRTVLVGLKGTSTTDVVVADKQSRTPWASAVFLDDAYLTVPDPHNVRSIVLPDAGRTYRFAPAVANDVAVELIQALTKLPILQGAYHPVRVLVRNRGRNAQSNVRVTLTVSGANTYTATQNIASLPLGPAAVVAFAGYTLTNPGPTTLTVSTPADDNNGNNSFSLAQDVNATTYAYAEPGNFATSSRGYGPGTSYNVNATLLHTSTALQVTQVRAFVLNGATGLGVTEGKTVYAVLMDGTGTVLARSADHVVSAAEINTYLGFPLTTLVTMSAGSDFYVGLAQTYQPGQTTQYYALGAQNDGPGRPATFYAASTTLTNPPFDLNQQGVTVKFMLEAVTQVVLGTRNAALAAQVGLYPNPARSAFAVTVPTGPLGTARYQLLNALGQPVQAGTLGLPAAGGTRTLDVRGLAAGVYSLQLLSGADLVVKRLVLE